MGKPNKRKAKLIKLEAANYKKFNAELDEERRINLEKQLKIETERMEKQKIDNEKYKLFCEQERLFRERERLLDEQQEKIKRFYESQIKSKLNR